jgi:hypothetical protein
MIDDTPSCKGDWKLGTACGKCQRCLDTAGTTIAELRAALIDVALDREAADAARPRSTHHLEQVLRLLQAEAVQAFVSEWAPLGEPHKMPRWLSGVVALVAAVHGDATAPWLKLAAERPPVGQDRFCVLSRSLTTAVIRMGVGSGACWINLTCNKADPPIEHLADRICRALNGEGH